MTYEEFLTTAAQEINEKLFEVLQNWKNEIHQTTPTLDSLAEAFIEQCHGGKRLRGSLVKLGYLLAGGISTDEILLAAVACEIFQTSILVHDDVIDKSSLRRGKPALHVALGDNHYGISQAISLADLGFFLSVELLTSLPLSNDKKNKIVSFFSYVSQETAKGEMLDVMLPTVSSFEEANVISIAKLKTALYSFIGPLTIGALGSDADSALLRSINEFGENTGVAFQIQDDILGIFADTTIFGKSNLSDIQEGKRTLLLWYALRHASEQDVHFLKEIYGNPSATSEDAKKIQDIFIRSGAHKYAVESAQAYTQKAQDIISSLSSDREIRLLLLDMTEFLMKRTK